MSEEDFSQERERVYDSLFGKCETVNHEIVPLIPHIDVYIHKPGFNKRPFYTLVTGGMSDLPMKVPAEVGPGFSRAEIICYVDEPKEIYMKALRFLARFPHEYETWLGVGHTIPNGQPPAPFFEGSQLAVALLISTIVKSDFDLLGQFQIHGEPVNFLWFVPITEAECSFKLQRGMTAVFDLLEHHKHPVTLNPLRKSYV
jgi:hypothetical protein